MNYKKHILSNVTSNNLFSDKEKSKAESTVNTINLAIPYIPKEFDSQIL